MAKVAPRALQHLEMTQRLPKLLLRFGLSHTPSSMVSFQAMPIVIPRLSSNVIQVSLRGRPHLLPGLSLLCGVNTELISIYTL